MMKITKKYKGIYYIPVIGGVSLQEILSGQPAWWQEGGYLNYPHSLIAYIYLKDISKDKLKKIQFSKEGIFMVDSSGFQVTRGININPKAVIRLEQQHGSCGFILDYPPYRRNPTKGGWVGTERRAVDLFDYSLERTVDNVKIMKHNMEDEYKDFVLYGVVHGQTHLQRMKWYEQVSPLYDFDAWAVAPQWVEKGGDFQQLVSFVLFAKERGIKNVHVFAISGVWKILVVVYLYKLLGCFDLMTFDSATASLQGIKRQMILDPIKAAATYMGTRKEYDPNVKIDCDCAVCKNFSTDYLRQEKGVPNPVELIIQHNIHMLVERVKIFEQMPIKDIERQLKPKALRIIDTALKLGEEKFHKMIGDEKHFGKKLRQRTL